MSIVLREHEWAENMIRSKTLGKKPSETLSRVARYYIDKGYSKKETRNFLDTFLIQCEPTSSLPKWSDALDYALARALKYDAIDIDGIDITKPEMDKIDALDGKQIKRLAFTLLCLAKYWKIVMPNGDSWVNNKDNEIMAMANINTSIKRQGMMYRTLRECGMVQFSKKVDNTNVRVCFAEDGDVVMHVTDFKNLGYQYMMATGSNDFIICQNCGTVVRKNTVKPAGYRQNSGKQKYCKSCAAEIVIQQNVNRAMRFRDKHKDKVANYYVYMHQCPNQKRYIGVTSTTLDKRWKKGVGYIDNESFYSDIKKYGWDNIKHYKIAVVQDEHLARKIESLFIQRYKTTTKKNGYNRVSGEMIYEYDELLAEAYSPVEVDGCGIDMCEVKTTLQKDNNRKTNKGATYAKKVRCVETGEVFDNVREASISCGVCSPEAIRQSIYKGHSSGKFVIEDEECGAYTVHAHWEYID